jgi:predicted metal-binding membrane protein
VRRWARLRRRHPEWWVVPLALVAWLALAAVQVAALGSSSTTSIQAAQAHHGHAHAGSTPASPAVAAAASPAADVGMAALMAVAMMAPAALPMVRHVTIASLWPRRARSGLLYLAAYLAVWTIVGVVLSLLVASVARLTAAPVALALTFLLAAGWQLTRWKQQMLQQCGRSRPLPPAGWRADVATLRFGAVAAVPCVATCWGFMAAAAAAGHGIPVMAALFAVQMRERVGVPRSRARSGASLAALGVAVLAFAASGYVPSG